MRYFTFCALLLWSAANLGAQTPQTFRVAKPEEAGFDGVRLARIDSMLESFVRQGILPHAVTFIARKGMVVHHKAYGNSNLAKKTPTRRDDIYRIASQSKMITTVGLMILMEEGKFYLDQPIADFIPAFSNPRVLVSFDEKDPAKYITRPAKRAITIRHLLSHSAGIPYEHPLNGLPEFQVPMLFETGPMTIAQAVEKMAKRPLIEDPGEKFVYGLNTDILGRLIEVLSGQPLDVFLQKRVLEPLSMVDTYFYLPTGKTNRLVELYSKDKGSDPLTVHSIQQYRDYPVTGARTYFGGGAGMVSTVEDYAKFCQMLLNQGEFNGKRLLSRATIALLMRNQIHDNEVWDREDKFGLGLQIFSDHSHYGDNATPGAVMWGGYFCSEYTIDPKEDLILLAFTNVQPFSHGSDFLRKFRILVYAALK
jgi:CubicO group peptidase (beta-lactamase class C family)